MKLKNATKKTTIHVDYSDVEDLIKEVYGHPYEIMPMEEVGSSQYSAAWDLTVHKEALTGYEEEELDTLKTGKPSHFIIHTILKDLCNRGHMEEGEYSMSINW